MRLEVQPAEPSDFDLACQVYGPETGDFTSPLAQATWPLTAESDLDQHRRRAEWSCRQQRDAAAHDPAVRLMKVVDLDIDPNDPKRFIAFARWSNLEDGYREIGDLNVSGTKDRNDPATWPPEMNSALWIAIVEALFKGRAEWMGKGKYWVLTTVVTRNEYRKRGAGGLLLRWGVAQAHADGVPAFLESTPANQKWYEGFGFRKVGEQTTEVKGVKMDIVRMRADP